MTKPKTREVRVFHDDSCNRYFRITKAGTLCRMSNERCFDFLSKLKERGFKEVGKSGDMDEIVLRKEVT